MDRRGQATAYAAQRLPGGRPKNLIIAVIATVLVLVVFINIAKVDTVVEEGRVVAGRLQKLKGEMHVPDSMVRPFANLHNPFRQPAHPPPVQANSTHGDASWFSDWKWRNPFSSTVTLDEDRALLPPVQARPPVYAYYEPREAKADAALKLAEERLLEVWRKAWWAQGFKPVVLGPRDAMENPLYQKVQAVNMTAGVQLEIMRLLAWSHMGDGVLANWLVVPMASYYSPLLIYLRDARYFTLTRYQDLGMGLFAGPKQDIDKAIDFFLKDERINRDDSLMDLISSQEELTHIETRRKGVAFYNDRTIKNKYPEIAEVLKTSSAKAYQMLANLITAHLHATFLDQYSDGIAVVSPHTGNATLVHHRALTLARALNTCPSDPSSAADASKAITSCPPNRPDCKGCKPVALKFPSAAPNKTSVFTVGTVPHTYTLTRLLAPHAETFNFTVSYIRRRTTRDPFIESVTKEISSAGVSNYDRIVTFKEFVAQPGKGAMRSLWRHAEADWSWDELEWRLGFGLPRPSQPDVSNAMGEPVPQSAIADGGLELQDVGVPKNPEVLAPLLESMKDTPPPKPEDFVDQVRIMKSTREQLDKKKWTAPGPDLRKVCEAWHLADAEAWRFVRALGAREEMERKKWAEEERKYKP